MKFVGSHTKLLFVLFPLLYSCATLLNKPVQKIFITTDSTVRVLYVERALAIDSSLVSLPVTRTYFVPRSNKPLTITLQVDSGIKQLHLKSKNSFAYWLNIPENYGIGMFVDRDNVKRYSYPTRNYFSIKDTLVERKRFCPIEKGFISFSLSLPFVNLFDVQTTNSTYKSGGPFGIEAGLDYFYKRNKYISFSTGAATDVFGEYWLLDSGYLDHNNAWFAGLRNNYVTGSFDFGYGIHISQLKWTRQFGDTLKKSLSISNLGLGASLSAQYRVGNYFRIGVLYQPVFIDIRHMSFTNYQHYLSLAVMWKFPLRRKFE